MKFAILYFLFAFYCNVVNTQFYCADLLQQCAKSAAEFTEQILAFKENAFKTCVKRPSCQTEKKIFDDCFDASVSATHISTVSFNQQSTTVDGDSRMKSNSPINYTKYNTLEKFFAEKALKFRSALDQCFVKSPFVPRRNFFGPTILDEDASYARGIYQFDLADRLWGLPEMTVTRPSLDTLGVCGTTRTVLRLFGSGIDRTSRSNDPTRNNLTSACMLDEDEISCYRETLDLNPDYIQLVYNRDYALRGCVQSIRQQSVCRISDRSRLRSCLCNVREHYDNEIQTAILQCVKSKNQKPQAVIIEMSSSLDSDSVVDSLSDSDTLSSFTKNQTSSQEQVEAAKLTFDTPGAVINGQCMCSCGNQKPITSQKMKSFLDDKAIEDISVPQKKTNPPKINSASFKENSPRLMQPSDASGRVFWTNNITIF